MSRAAALKSFYAVLEAHEPLTSFISHTVGATRVSQGCRILGKSVYLDDLTEKLPLIALRVPQNNARGNASPRLMTVQLEAHGKDVYEVVDLLDHIQAACEAFRSNAFPNTPAHINGVTVGNDEDLALLDPMLRNPAALILVSIKWTPKL